MYNLFYNLDDRPFDSKPDLKYFYASRTHKHTILQMRVGFEQPDGVLTLTGDKGTGKTTLISHMLNQMDNNKNIVALIQKPQQKDHEFLPEILTALKIPFIESQPKLLFNTLHNFLLEKSKEKKKILLVIDNAENLSPSSFDFIHLLSTLNLNEQGLLQIALVGTNKLEAALSTTENQAFRQQITMSYAMHPLQTADTRKYIEHRLNIAGWSGNPTIDDDVFDTIHQLAEGIPTKINRYCDRLFLLGMLCKTHHLRQKDISNLTLATMEKLDNFEATRLKQEEEANNQSPEDNIDQLISSHTASYDEVSSKTYSISSQESNNATPPNQTTTELHHENHTQKPPEGSSKPFLNKQTVITIMAVYLVSSVAVFAYDRMSKTNNPFKTASTEQHNTKQHNTSHLSPSDSSSKLAKYTLTEITSTSGSSSKDIQLLNIESLPTKPSSINSNVKHETLAIETVSDSLGGF